MSTVTETRVGAHSEVGTLRTVMVHRPDLAHDGVDAAAAIA
jgi:arginine deiminase